MNTVDNDRPIKPGDVNDAFDPQEVFSPKRQHHLQPGLENIAPDRLVDRKAEGLDVIVMPVDVIVIMMVVMPVVVGLFFQPVLYVRTFGLRVVHASVK